MAVTSDVNKLHQSGYAIKDSGKRETFMSGMVRDTQEGKIEYDRILDGPMFDRWSEHLTKGAVKYPDSPDGSANWTKATGAAELRRFRKSAFRHFRAWMRGDTDEDHAAGVFFNINGAEYVKDRMASSAIQYQWEGTNAWTVIPTVPYATLTGVSVGGKERKKEVRNDPADNLTPADIASANAYADGLRDRAA